MPIQTTFSSTGNNLASLLKQVTGEQEIVIINRRGYDDAAIVSVNFSVSSKSHLSPANNEPNLCRV